MMVLVTGAAGFIGSHMAERLNSEGHEVIGVDNFSGFYDTGLKYNNAAILKKKGIQVISLDLCDENFSEALPNDFEYIFHFAAQPGIESTCTYTEYWNNNIKATLRLLEFAEQCPSLKMFVNIATSSIYGAHATGDELELPQPTSHYGVTKLAAEQMALSKARLGIINACSLRLYSVYGPRERPDKLFRKLLFSGINNSEFPLFEGSLNHSRSFTFIDDIIDGIMTVIGREAVCNKEIFNIGNDKGQTTRQGIEIVEKLLGTRILLKMLPARIEDQQFTKANIDKAKKLLGYQSKTSLPEGVRKQLEWFMETSQSTSLSTNFSSENLR